MIAPQAEDTTIAESPVIFVFMNRLQHSPGLGFADDANFPARARLYVLIGPTG